MCSRQMPQLFIPLICCYLLNAIHHLFYVYIGNQLWFKGHGKQRTPSNDDDDIFPHAREVS